MMARRSAISVRLRRLARSEVGASAIEFAITAPLFFMLLFGIVIYGYYFASLGVINHIASETARATIAGLSDAERDSLAQIRAGELVASYSGVIDPQSIDVQASPGGEGIYVVTVRYEFGLLALLGGSTLLPLPPSEHTTRVEISHGGY